MIADRHQPTPTPGISPLGEGRGSQLASGARADQQREQLGDLCRIAIHQLAERFEATIKPVDLLIKGCQPAAAPP
ncbi:hypothetical protein [Streptomyces flavidovirens]|uniref:Uncharacterized protein n=1 Tax=Streptomyces flavidovirens TaxID=67298 RepID=A0ABW6RQK5_9ACTN